MMSSAHHRGQQQQQQKQQPGGGGGVDEARKAAQERSVAIAAENLSFIYGKQKGSQVLVHCVVCVYIYMYVC